MTEFLEKINKLVSLHWGRILLLFLCPLFLIGFYDVIFDLTLSGVHAAFEWVEFALEEIIESIFHTTRKQTQTIVFYLILFFSAYFCYCLGLKLIDLYHSFIKKIIDIKAAYQARILHRWSHLSAAQKIKILLSGSAGIGVMVYLTLS